MAPGIITKTDYFIHSSMTFRLHCLLIYQVLFELNMQLWLILYINQKLYAVGATFAPSPDSL